MTKVITKGAVVVSGVERKAVLPTNSSEVDRNLVLDGSDRPFELGGGIHASEVSALGSGVVHGPVMVGGHIRLDADSTARQRYLGGLSAYGQICTRSGSDGASSPVDSPAGTLDGIRFVIRGDVSAGESVELENTLVVGSVTAPKVRLTGSIILGQIRSRRSPGELHAVCSTFGRFDVSRLVLEGPTSLLFAGGSSDEPPDCRDHAGSDGNAYPFSLRLLALCRQKAVGCGFPNRPLGEPTNGDSLGSSAEAPGVCCDYWVRQTCPFSGRVAMFETDFLRDEDQEGPEADPDHGVESAAPPNGRWHFGLQRRALNLKPLEESGSTFNDALHAVFAFEHLTDAAKHRVRKTLDSKKLSTQESELLRLAIDGL